ncbi:MAG: carboxypeptidase-like regulatory domain-containing protein [Bryobacteraceae bacterium]
MSLVARSLLIVLACSVMSLAQDIRTATVVGTATDPSGAAVPNAQVTAINLQTKVETKTQTTPDGEYYLPFLNLGTYDVSVESPGFKKFVRTGLILEAGATVRVDVKFEVGATTQAVEVTAATPLLATDDAVVGGLDDAKKIEESSMLQSKPQHLMYYMEGAYSDNGGTYHILGEPANLINYTVDGANVKQSIRSAIGETSTSLTVPVDSVAEAQVWTTGIPAEVGHSAGGTYNMVLKSGTNQLHFATEERYINKDFVDRAYFQQSVANLATAPFEYHNFNAALNGPIVIPKLYDGRNKTFFMLAYRLDYDHEANVSTTSTPDAGMLSGNFAFGGLGYPIYDPKSIACTLAAGCPSSSGWTAAVFPNYQIPQSRFDPVAAKFLSFSPYTPANTAGFYSATGPNNNLTALTHYLSDREGYILKIDEQLGNNDRFFVRWGSNMFREPIGRNAVQYAWGAIDSTEYSYGLREPIDVKNPTLGYYHNFSPTLINEFRFAYQRRNDTVQPQLNNQGWAGILGVPGVGPQTFPGFVGASGGSSVTWNANPSGTASNYLRTLNEDFEFIDNVTKVVGAHTFKAGYQGMIVRENDISVSQPSGVYNFATSGSGLPFTPNTGNSFASFLLGSVTSATFTNLLANYLPRWWSHQFYVQDDWRILHNMTINFGVRYSYESPANTKWGLKSEFNPNVVDPLTGLMGAITNPKGNLYSADHKNFAPRLGLSWNFAPKFVFRGSIDFFTQDVMPELGQDNYLATANVQQPSGNPYPAFYLSQGPGPVNYTINPSTYTANYVGTNYSARTATYIDPNLRNPYSMTWASGFQYEFKPNQVAEVVYQGSNGVGLVPSSGVASSTTAPNPGNAVNINVLPLSIYQSTNTTLLSQVYAGSQNYLTYPQFGTITYYGNYGHSTYNALTARVERRFNNGFSYNFLFTWSRNLAGTAGSGEQFYDWNLTKGPTATDVKLMGVATFTYDLPFGKHRKYLNRNTTLGYMADVLVGGWTFTSIQSMRTGEPLFFTMAGSPYKQLSGQTIPNIVPGQKINVSNYSVGPNLWPESNQNPFLNINAFSYPGNYQNGDAGVGIARQGNVWWPEYSLYNGRFAPLTGYSYSNWYTPNPNWQGILRLEF